MKHRRFTILVCLAISAMAGMGLLRLQISTDNRVFYGAENPYFIDFLKFESEFTTNDNVVFVINGTSAILEGRFPEAIRWLTKEAYALEHAIRVDSLANYPYPTGNKDSITVQSILDWACSESSHCNSNIDTPLDELHLYNRLASPDLRSAGVIATLSIERGAVGQIEALQSDIRQIAKEFEREFPEFKIYFTGGVPMMAAFAEASAGDLSVLLPISFLIILVLLTIVLGSIYLAIAILGVGLITSVMVLGIAGWLGLVINNATSIAPIVIITLVVTSAMHLAVHFSNSRFRNTTPPETTRQAIASTLANRAPLVISALTSAASLASLSLVDSPPLRQLGILSAAGTIIGCTLTLTLLPVCFSYAGPPRFSRLSERLQQQVNRYARIIERSGGPTIPAAALFAVAALGLTQLSIDDDFVRFFDESVDFRVQTDRTTELLAGPNHIEVVLSSGEGETVFSPRFLIHLKQITEELRADPLVANAHSFSDVMSHLSRVFYERDIDMRMTEEELHQLFLIYELSLSIGQTNTDLVNASHDSARVSTLLKDSKSSDIQRLEETVYREHEAKGTAYELVVTGENIPVAHLSRLNIQSMLVGIGIALVATALAIGIWFRSARLSLVAFIATTIPVLAGFGLWGWSAEPIGLATTAIIALTVGVVVDDTAHFLYRFLDSRASLGLTSLQAAAYSTHKVGTAITSTSIVLSAGLGLLAFSTFQVNSIFGIVTTLIIMLALLFDLAILPRLAVWADRSSSSSS
jgi:uncharacterized protein